MSDLDGTDAFQRLLETAIDSAAALKVEEEKRRAAEDNVRDLDRTINDLRSRISTLEQKQATALPKLSELHSAAALMLGMGASVEDDVRDRLKKALEAAGRYCDEIPF